MLSRQIVRPLAVVFTVVGIVLVALAIVYMTTKASSLPSWIPGHLAERVTKRGKIIGNKTHLKRGLVVLVVAVATFATTWWLAFRYEPAD